MSREELIGERIWDVFPHAVGSKFETEYRRALETRLPTHFEEYYPEPLNQWLECNCYPSSDGLSVFFRDVTGRKRAEEELGRLLEESQVKNEELIAANEQLVRAIRTAEEAVKARDEFLSVAAHELKTPVTSLRGFAQTLARQYDKYGAVEAERLGRALQVIDQQSNKLAKLVTQLLDTARLESGRLVLEREPTDLVSLVEEVAALARPVTSRHSIVVEAPPRVEALVDSVRIEQVVTNLVDNAIRYSADGGVVEIKVEALAREVTIAVRDRGIGIPPEHLPHLFQRFYRAHEGGSIAGIGLGLFVSREIVALHGGRIEVECPPDGGSRFVVSLPLR